MIEPVDLASGRFEIEQHIAEPVSAAHWHDHIELNLLVSAAMSHLFNGREERVEAGQHLVLFWAALPHRTIEHQNQSCM
jgi:hypothetical protein